MSVKLAVCLDAVLKWILCRHYNGWASGTYCKFGFISVNTTQNSAHYMGITYFHSILRGPQVSNRLLFLLLHHFKPWVSNLFSQRATTAFVNWLAGRACKNHSKIWYTYLPKLKIINSTEFYYKSATSLY
jgi:hypothetical protein